MKIVTWIMANGAALLGIVQGIVKVLKELCTLIIDLLSLFMPAEKAQAIVNGVRGLFNKIDGLIEKVKGYLV
jgi:phage-related protein